MKDNFRIAYAHQSCGWSCCSAFPKHPWFSLTQCASWQDNSEKGEMSEDELRPRLDFIGTTYTLPGGCWCVPAAEEGLANSTVIIFLCFEGCFFNALATMKSYRHLAGHWGVQKAGRPQCQACQDLQTESIFRTTGSEPGDSQTVDGWRWTAKESFEHSYQSKWR